ERLARGRLRVVEAEVVDQLLDAHGASRRQVTVGDKSPHVGVGRRVHVDRERRERAVINAAESVLLDVVVALGIERAYVAAFRRASTTGKAPDLRRSIRRRSGRSRGGRSRRRRRGSSRTALGIHDWSFTRDDHGLFQRTDPHLDRHSLGSAAGERQSTPDYSESRQRDFERVLTTLQTNKRELTAVVGDRTALVTAVTSGERHRCAGQRNAGCIDHDAGDYTVSALRREEWNQEQQDEDGGPNACTHGITSQADVSRRSKDRRLAAGSMAKPVPRPTPDVGLDYEPHSVDR